MESQPLLRTQALLARFGIMAVHLAQRLQHVTAFGGKVLSHFYKLSATVREAFGQQDLHAGRQLRHVARQRIAHLDQRGQFRSPLLQYLGQILARMLGSGEVQRDLSALRP
jgi:hypothetical protein